MQTEQKIKKTLAILQKQVIQLYKEHPDWDIPESDEIRKYGAACVGLVEYDNKVLNVASLDIRKGNDYYTITAKCHHKEYGKLVK